MQWLPSWEGLILSSQTVLLQPILDAALGRQCLLQADVLWLSLLLPRCCVPCLAARVPRGVFNSLHCWPQWFPGIQISPSLAATCEGKPWLNNRQFPSWQTVLDMSQLPWERGDYLGWNLIATGVNTCCTVNACLHDCCLLSSWNRSFSAWVNGNKVFGLNLPSVIG